MAHCGKIVQDCKLEIDSPIGTTAKPAFLPRVACAAGFSSLGDDFFGFVFFSIVFAGFDFSAAFGCLVAFSR